MAAIKIQNNKSILLDVYRPPSPNFSSFLNNFQELLLHNSQFNCLFETVILEHSVNLIIFKDLLECFHLTSTIIEPTGVTTTSSTSIGNFLVSSSIVQTSKVINFGLPNLSTQNIQIKTFYNVLPNKDSNSNYWKKLLVRKTY